MSENEYKVTFLLDKSNLWFEKLLKNYDLSKSKYTFKISKNPNNIKNQILYFLYLILKYYLKIL